MTVGTSVSIFVIFDAAEKSLLLVKNGPQKKNRVFFTKHIFIFGSIPNFFILVNFTGEMSKRVSSKMGGILLRSHHRDI